MIHEPSKDRIAMTTGQACEDIAKKTNIHRSRVDEIIKLYIECVKDAMRAEMTFDMHGFARFYFVYRSHGKKNAVRRKPCFTLVTQFNDEISGYVHDLGIPDNKSRTLLKVKMKPDEIVKVRKRMILDEQRTLGFSPDLLFEDTDMVSSQLKDREGTLPTVQDVINRLNEFRTRTGVM